MKVFALIAFLALGAAESRVELVTKEIEYKAGDVVCEGYVAWPKDAKGKLPGVLVCHQWMGHTPYERMRVEDLREFGKRWAPYRSVATWYLWRSLDPSPGEY